MFKRIFTCSAFALTTLIGCTNSNNVNAPAQYQCADGQQPTQVTPEPSYVFVKCQNGQIVTVPIASVPGQQYHSGGDVMNDPFFWMWMFGSSYHSYPVYTHYITSPTYYHYRTIYSNRTYTPAAQRTITTNSGTYKTSTATNSNNVYRSSTTSITRISGSSGGGSGFGGFKSSSRK